MSSTSRTRGVIRRSFSLPPRFWTEVSPQTMDLMPWLSTTGTPAQSSSRARSPPSISFCSAASSLSVASPMVSRPVSSTMTTGPERRSLTAKAIPSPASRAAGRQPPGGTPHYTPAPRRPFLFVPPRARVAGFDGGAHAAAGGELAAHLRPRRAAGGHHVAQDAVHGVLVKDAQVAVGQDVHLERLQFQAAAARLVAEGERAEVGLPRARADGGVLRDGDGDGVAGKLVFPGLDLRQARLDPGPRVLLGVRGHHSPASARHHSTAPRFLDSPGESPSAVLFA